MARIGKIARLPREIREQVNRKLADGESGVGLVRWLNGLPPVVLVLKAEFEERPINEQNLTDWKQGGYCDWQARQETLAQARELAADAKEIGEAADGSLADHLCTALTARYAGMLSDWNGEADEGFMRKLRALRTVSQEIVELRRGDHSAAKLKLERDQLEEKREWSEEEVVEYFQRWAKNSRVREAICGKCMSPEERENRIRQIFGMSVSTPPPSEQNVTGEEDGDQPESR